MLFYITKGRISFSLHMDLILSFCRWGSEFFFAYGPDITVPVLEYSIKVVLGLLGAKMAA